MSKLIVKRLSPDATLPVRASSYSAGYDLSSCEDVVVPAGGQLLVKTGLAVTVPLGTYGQISSRSGLALKHRITAFPGVFGS